MNESFAIRLLAQLGTRLAAAPSSQPTTDPGRLPQWPVGTTGYHVDQGWLRIYSMERGVSAATTLAVMLVGTWLLLRIFRPFLRRHELQRPIATGALAITAYSTILALHTILMVDAKDLVAITIHRAFVAIMLVVAVRIVDRLVIVPLLTRGGKARLSKFVHQIILIVFSIFVAAGYCSWAFGLDISSFLAGSAVISIVLGLALQETLGNFFSGMVLQASLPFQPGDWIQIGDVEGRVVEMTWRAVTVMTNEDNYVLIPNGTVAKEQIVNFHTPTTATARTVEVGLEYDLPPHDARAVLLQAARDTEGVLPSPEPQVLLMDYADSAILYKIKFWIDEPRRHKGIENAVRVNIWYRLKSAGYGIPFPMRTVEYVNLDRKQLKARAADQSRRMRAITANPLFAGVPEDARAKLAREARDITLSAGQVVYRQDEAGDELYILLEGEVDVFARTDDGREYDVGDIVAGSFFGELSAMTGCPRPRTIRTRTDVAAIAVSRDHLQELFAADPELLNSISKMVAQREAEQLEQLKKLGSAGADSGQHAAQHSVLDRMKKMFGFLHR